MDAVTAAAPGSDVRPSEPGQTVKDLEASPGRTDMVLKIVDRVFAGISAMAVVIGGIYAYSLHLGERREERRKAEEQRQQEYNLREREFRLQLFKEQHPLYHDLCKTAARIASAEKLADANDSIKKFWELYYGELCLVEDQRVVEAVAAYADVLLDCEDKSESPPPRLPKLSMELAKACQQSMALEKVFGIATDR
jgi:hypothetical protein